MNIGISHKELSGILSGCSLIGATLWMADVLTWQAGYFITAGLEGLSLIVYYFYAKDRNKFLATGIILTGFALLITGMTTLICL
ncbi:hypothetical protein [Collinsella stercoris]|uniref:hypothetical protein n=1 Tax=Collinsella stercoris TaxID=147206 RepID=UPI0023F4EB4B|nr:hypothetical protein [Collinsella stercoris]